MAPAIVGNPGGIFTLQVLVIFKLVEETPQIHIAVEVMVLIFGPNAAVWRLVYPGSAFQGCPL